MAGKRRAKRLLFWIFSRKRYLSSNLIFVHIPKAAGTSVARAIYGKRVGHFTAEEMLAYLGDDFRKRIRFSVVRHPVDRLLSAYHYAIAGGTKEGAINNAKLYRGQSFETFERFVKEWLQFQDMTTVELIFRPQFQFIYDQKGTCLVDFVGKVEDMGAIEDWMSQNLKRAVLLPHANRSKRPGRNVRELDEETRSIIAHLYQKDFELFNYPPC